MAETILAKLRQEHKEIKNLLETIESSNSLELTRIRFNALKMILVPHMEGEEKSLYAHLKDDVHEELAEAIAEDADLEHHEIKEYLQRLNLLETGSSEWMKEFHSFKEHVEQHFREEETELFDEAKEDFSREELVRFGEEFEEIKHHPSL